MELHPLPSMPQLVAQGEARAVVNRRKPAASLEEAIQRVLDDGRKAMELEDSYIAWLNGDPVPQLKHPRRTLRQWLSGRRPEPAPVMTSIEPVWRSAQSG